MYRVGKAIIYKKKKSSSPVCCLSFASEQFRIPRNCIKVMEAPCDFVVQVFCFPPRHKAQAGLPTF